MKKAQKTNKKKLLYVITLGELGGAQKYVRDLASAYKDVYDITIVTSDGRTPDVEEEGGTTDGKTSGVGEERVSNQLLAWAEENDLGTLSLPALGRGLWRGVLPTKADYRVFWQLYTHLRDTHYDIIHLNSSKMGLIGALAAKLANFTRGNRASGKTPDVEEERRDGKTSGVEELAEEHAETRVVFTAHGWVFNEPGSIRKRGWFWRLLSKVAAWFQDRIINVSDHDLSRAVAHRIAPNRKLYTVYNGIDRGNYRFASRGRARDWLAERTGINSATPVVGTIANLYKTKDLGTMVAALTELPDSTVLVIIGGGCGEEPRRTKKELERLAGRLGLQHRVFLLGSIPDGWQWLRAFDVYAISSLKEGLPYSALEAMAAGVPIVSTPAGGLKDLFGFEGSSRGVATHTEPTSAQSIYALPAAPQSPHSLARAIEAVLSDADLREAMVENAEERVRSAFTLKQMAIKTRWVYEF